MTSRGAEAAQRALGSGLRLALLSLIAGLCSVGQAGAMCDVIPQKRVAYRGAIGVIDRPWGGPGDRIEVSLDPAGCAGAGASFDVLVPDVIDLVASDFSVDSEGWTASPGFPIYQASGGNPDGWLSVIDSGGDATVLAPAPFEGDWASLGVTEIRWDHLINTNSGYPLGSVPLVHLSGPSGSATYTAYAGGAYRFVWTQLSVPVDAQAPPSGWSVQGSWSGLLANVTSMQIQVELLGGVNGESYGVDNVTLRGVGGPPVVPDPTANVVTMVFTPPTGPPAAVVVSPKSGGCALEPLASELVACQAELGSTDVACVENTSIAITSTRFSIPFLDPSPALPGAALAGPAKIAISPAAEPLPCELVSLRCADPGAPGNLAACVDELYAADGTCATDPANRAPSFAHFTALPAENAYRDMCVTPSEAPACTGSGPDVTATIDAEGNVLLPMDFEQIELAGALPTPRLIRFRTDIPAFAGQSAAIASPGSAFFDSYSTRGHLLPPFLSRISDPGAPDDLAFLATVDAPRGVLRLLRRSPTFRECRDDGTQAVLTPGVPCVVNGDCPAGSSCGVAACYDTATRLATGVQCTGDAGCGAGEECGPGLFDFASRLTAGEFVIGAADYHAEALHPVPLDCLLQGNGFIVGCRSERTEGIPINSDADTDDATVVTLRSAESGQAVLLQGELGLAASRVRRQTLTDPSVVVQGNLIAFLQSEADSDDGALGGDLTGDGDIEDTVLRVFRFDDVANISDLTPGIIASDAAPRVNDRSLVISDDLVFALEWEAASTPQTRITLSGSPLGLGVLPARQAQLTPDGRFAAFLTGSSLVVEDSDQHDDVYVVDRDPDQDGVFDVSSTLSFATPDLTGTYLGPDALDAPRLSDDGRWLVFSSCSRFLVSPAEPPSQYGGCGNDVFLRDMQLGTTVQITPGGSTFDANNPDISGDGRFIVFDAGDNVVPGDANFGQDIVLYDRDTDQDGVFDQQNATSMMLVTNDSVTATGYARSIRPRISRNGRWVAFTSRNLGMDPSDVESELDYDVFVASIDPSGAVGTPLRVSRTSELFRPLGDLDSPAGLLNSPPEISADGRYVTFDSRATNVPGAEFDGQKRFVVDRDADEDGIFDGSNEDGTLRVELRLIESVGFPTGGSQSSQYGLSPDGRFVIESADDFPGGDITDYYIHDLVTGTAATVFDRMFDTPLGFPTLSEDALFRGRTLLEAGEIEAEVTGIDTANLASDVSGDGDLDDRVLIVLDGLTDPATAFDAGPATQVRVAAGNALLLNPERRLAGGTDLNGDGDARDEVVFLWRNRQAGASINLGISARKIAISESLVAALVAEEDEGVDLNADLDLDDQVLFVNDLATATSGSWINTGLGADQLEVSGNRAAIRSTDAPTLGEARIYDAGSGIPTNVGAQALELVFEGDVLAFRTAENGTPLNGDGDTNDDVLQVYDLASATLFNTEQAAIRCPYEACDPARPFAIQRETVVFLTRELDQSGPNIGSGCADLGSGACDLDGDGLATGIVLQRFDVARRRAGLGNASSTESLPTTSSGICTDTGKGCNDDTDCVGGSCYTPPGGCVFETGAPCNPTMEGDCGAASFCQPIVGGPETDGICFDVLAASCESNAECALLNPNAVCSDQAAGLQRVPSPIPDGSSSNLAYASRGVCKTSTGREDGGCLTDADCVSGATCERDIVFAGLPDRDADGVPDLTDNCGAASNSGQADIDGDGVGDACDLQSCGDGVQSYAETCDDGNALPGDGCDADCQLEPGYIPACANGLDDDGDGLTDSGTDPGCASASDNSERDPSLPCDDGLNNDGDGLVDFPSDPGCETPTSPSESPECDDGIDNDGDGLTDATGPAPDPECATSAWHDDEATPVPEPDLVWSLFAGMLLLRHLYSRRRERLRVESC